MKPEIILIGLWIVYGFFHTITATQAIKDFFVNLLGKYAQYYRLIYNGLAFLFLLPIVYYQLMIPSESLLEKSLMNQILGGLMMASGVFLVFAALKNYDLSAFLGSEALTKTPVKVPVLKREELLSIVRHPLYLGILLFLWGWFGFSGLLSSLATAVTLSIYVRIGIYFEEKKLVLQFGKPYQEYQKQVPMLIPKLGDGE